MPVTRGDVTLTYVPNVGAPGGKVRPALIVQSDHNNSRLNETIIAAITSNVREAEVRADHLGFPAGALTALRAINEHIEP